MSLLAVVIKRPFVFFSTVEVVLLLLIKISFLLLIVVNDAAVNDDAAYVRPVAVACFHVVLLEDGMEIVVCCEALLDKVEEGLNDVGLYIFAVWGGGGVHQMMFLLLILFVGTQLCFSHLR